MTLLYERRNPLVLIRVNGKDAPEIQQARISWRYRGRIGKRGEADLVLSDPQRKILDELLQPNDIYEVAWGYPGNMSRPRTFRLKTWSTPFDVDGYHITLKLQITGRTPINNGDDPSELHRIKKGKNWGKVTSSEIAKKIAKKHKLKFKGDDSDDADDIPYVQSADVSDYGYLSMLADDIDFEFFIEGGTLFYRSKPYSERPRRVLWYHPARGETLLYRFVPEVKVVAASTKSRGANSEGSDPFAAAVAASEAANAHLNAALAQAAAKEEVSSSQVKTAALLDKAQNATASAKSGNVDAVKAAKDARAGLEEGLANLRKVQRDLKSAKQETGAQTYGERTPQQNADAKSGNCNRNAAKDGSTPTGAPKDEAAVRLGLGDARTLEFVGSTENSVGVGDASDKKRQKVACAKQSQLKDKAVSADAECVGDPSLREKVNFLIMGVRKQFSGSWYCNESEHIVVDDYTVVMKLKRGSLKRVKKGKGSPSSGKKDEGTQKMENVFVLTLDDRRQASLQTRPAVGDK